jgi:hypothetical protein
LVIKPGPSPGSPAPKTLQNYLHVILRFLNFLKNKVLKRPSMAGQKISEISGQGIPALRPAWHQKQQEHLHVDGNFAA